MELVEGARRRQEVVRRVLGVEPDLDGVSPQGRVGRLGRQRLAGRHVELQPHQVEAGDQLGHRVLDLEPGVDLEEEEPAVGGKQELHGAGAQVAQRPTGLDRGRAHRLAEVGVDGG